LLFDWYQGYWWTKNKVFQNHAAYKRVIYFYRDGITDCWVSAKDKDDFGKRMINSSKNTSKYFNNVAQQLVVKGEKVTKFINTHKYQNLDPVSFHQYWQILGEYFNYHINLKYVIDYLNDKQLAKYLPILEKARIKTELVPRHAEDFIQQFAGHLAVKAGYSKDLMLCVTGAEINKYFLTKKLPKVSELKSRYTSGSLVYGQKSYKIFTGKKTQQIKKFTEVTKNLKQAKGQLAYPGLVIGKVKVILNPLKENKKFKKGDVLITGMTRPDYLPLMNLASAVVTDAGGLLCHAAITARELKIPTIIGTKIATKVFKDGDLVEVDANKGIVRKISN
jgi:phosphohistidine swiveling domain-containing protein